MRNKLLTTMSLAALLTGCPAPTIEMDNPLDKLELRAASYHTAEQEAQYTTPSFQIEDAERYCGALALGSPQGASLQLDGSFSFDKQAYEEEFSRRYSGCMEGLLGPNWNEQN